MNTAVDPVHRPSRKASVGRCSAAARGWPVERVLFAMAGTVVLLASAFAAFISPWFLLLAVFVGLNQWLYALVGDCPASLILARVFGFRRGIPR